MKLTFGDFNNGYRPYTLIGAVAHLLGSLESGDYLPVEYPEMMYGKTIDATKLRAVINKIGLPSGGRYYTRMVNGVFHVGKY